MHRVDRPRPTRNRHSHESGSHSAATSSNGQNAVRECRDVTFLDLDLDEISAIVFPHMGNERLARVDGSRESTRPPQYRGRVTAEKCVDERLASHAVRAQTV